jgi:hypothetical protein
MIRHFIKLKGYLNSLLYSWDIHGQGPSSLAQRIHSGWKYEAILSHPGA